MKLKKVGAICSAGGCYYLTNQKNSAGDTVYQWLGDGSAAYPLVGLPYMDMENICAMFDITEKKQQKLVMCMTDTPAAMNWDDADPLERQLADPKLCVRYDRRDLLPLETSAGITFIQEKYLTPLDSLEYMHLFERRSTDGGLYIVAKVGMMIQAVIMPMDLPDKDFMDLLDSLTHQCRDAMRRREILRHVQDSGGENSLFDVDKSTGEIIGEGADRK